MQNQPMPAQERRARIAEQVRLSGAATIEELARSYGVTEQTIRRDVNTLCDDGILRRRHGGVEVAPQRDNLSYDTRKVLNLPAKTAIARSVAEAIPDGASLFFSIGTTPEVVALALAGHRDLRVVTNNLNVASACCANPTFEVAIVGGRVRPRHRDVVGREVEAVFANYSVDFGVFGVGGIDGDGGLLDFCEDEVRVRQAILANCRRSLLVADGTKFGRTAPVRGGHVTEVDALFTDTTPPRPICVRLSQAGVALHVAGAPLLEASA